MLRGLVSSACRWLHGLNRSFQCDHVPAPDLLGVGGPRPYQRLESVVLTEEVNRTLFRDFAEHLHGPRGEEEVGWVLLGVRQEKEAVVLATLPAGADRQAGVAHVSFNRAGQAVGARVVRQQDRRLAMVGVVHTHPGSLRHPSEGDYQGDSAWVGQLRGGEGVFGIGTADAGPRNGTGEAPHVRARGALCFSWYALADGDARYRKLAVRTVPGPDLARPLHPLWGTIEAHADVLDELCRQLARVNFDIVEDGGSRALALNLAVAQPGTVLRLVFRPREVRYYVERPGELTAVDPAEPDVGRAVYLLLAELARHKNRPGPAVATGSAPR
jgi:proteasome lid subunit RPN8/RPN11